jgi:hypothetical protein
MVKFSHKVKSSTIAAIGTRFGKWLNEQGVFDFDADAKLSLVMDLRAADGVNGNKKIDFERLLAADDFNFIHDVGGIQRHMNRETGKLENCFLPRCARKLEAA